MYRRGDGGIEIALGEQRDRLTGRRAVRLPKGKLEPGETPEQAALREVREETGLTGQVVAPLGTVEYAYRDAAGRVAKSVHFFLMECANGVRRVRDREFDRVSWCPIGTAAGRLSFESERRIVERAVELLADRQRP